MDILVIVNGEYGRRHLANIRKYAPLSWQIKTWDAPWAFPLVIDYPEDFLPSELPKADLILSFTEHKGAVELLPDLARMTGAQAVLASIDNEAWLPRGLARQLHGWLEKIGVACVTPKPLCSLTEQDYGVTRRQRTAYDNPFIAEFACYFGQPELQIEVDAEKRVITEVFVKRDAVCGCARHVAQYLIGIPIDEAEEKAGLLHHHYPCLASMEKDSDFGDTLMHISGNILKDNVRQQIKPYLKDFYITPGERVE